MAEAHVTLGGWRGLASGRDPLALDPGELTVARGLWFKPDDPSSRAWKLPGRTDATAGASGGTVGTTTTVRAIEHLQFDAAHTSQLVVWANSNLYRGAASTAVNTWTTIKDVQSPTPVAFTQSGTKPKALHDGRGRWILWSGVSGERPLLIDSSLNARYLGLRAPNQPSLADNTTVEATRRATGVDAGGTWSNTASAYDADSDTNSSVARSSAGSSLQVWNFSSVGPGTGTSNHRLIVRFGTSSLPPESASYPGRGEDVGAPVTEPLVASLKIEYTINADAGTPTWNTLFDGSIPVVVQDAQVPLSDSIDIPTKIKVRATLIYTSGTAQVYGRVYDIGLRQGAGTGVVTPGTYYYAITEAYYAADGKTIEAESEPCQVVPHTIPDPNSTRYGITVTLPSALTNATTDGCVATRVKRRVYRSTATGVYPSLGFVGEVGYDASGALVTSWVDDFNNLSGTTLGSPGIHVVDVGGVAFPAAGQPPALLDATLFRGAVVGIPYDDPYRFVWSLPGEPEYWPVPQNLALTTSDRNDDLRGIAQAGEHIILFQRTRTLRIRDLPFADRSTFDLAAAKVDVLSATEGLAGPPRAYCAFSLPGGQSVVAWVSDNGIWMTDGSVPSEDGIGARKLTSHIDWPATVSQTALSSAELTYNPIRQLLCFDYDDSGSTRRRLLLHVAPIHWIEVEGQKVPKITGPHTIGSSSNEIVANTVGESGGTFLQWSVSTNGKVWNEWTGTEDVANFYNSAGDIETVWETGWAYLAGPLGHFMVHQGALLHTDWGEAQQANVLFQFRRDDHAVSQKVAKRGVSLAGERANKLWLSRLGQAMKVTVEHIGKATGAFGPLILVANGVREEEGS